MPAATEIADPKSPPFVGHPLIGAGVVGVAGSVAPLAPWPALLVALTWTFCLLVDKARGAPLHAANLGRALGLLVWFLVCGTRTTAALAEYETIYDKTRLEISRPARCAGVARVTESPTVRAAAEGEENVVVWTGEAPRLDCEGKILGTPRALRLYGGPEDLARGDRVEFVAQLAPLRLFRNAPLSSPWPGAARRGPVLSGSIVFSERVQSGSGLLAWIDHQRARIRKRIWATYSPKSAPLGRALVLGENDLDPEDAEAFRNSGLLHLLAVSGTHLVIAVVALVQGLTALLVRIGPIARRFDVRRIASLTGALLSILYADFSGGSGSAWRAAFMLCLVCGGRALGLKVGGAGALGASLLVGLGIDPLIGSDYSFLLSALATSGLIALGQPFARHLSRGVLALPLLRPLVLSFVATITSTLPCAPVLSMMDGDMTWAALFANVIAGPMGEMVALPACLLHTLTEPIPALERGLGLIGSGALYWVRAIALFSASVEGAQFPVPFPSPYDTASMVAAIPLIPLIRRQLAPLFGRATAGATAVSGCLLIVLVVTSRGDGLTQRLSVTALDVGQGDALLIDFPDGKVALLDAGGFATGFPDTGERVVLPVLRARGIERLDLLVLSHPHPDHMMGLLSVTRHIPVSEVWLPGIHPPKKGTLEDILSQAEKRGAKVRTASTLCENHQIGGISIEVLAPCTEASRSMGANDASLVLRLEYGQRSALLTGDIEKAGEADLLATRRGRLRADLLKVPHHGSDTSSTPPFLEAVAPSVAFISSGVRNRFDHPRSSTLRNLDRRGILTLRTDLLGSLSWHTDGRNQWTTASDSAIVSSWKVATRKIRQPSTPVTGEPSPPSSQKRRSPVE